MSDVSLSCPHGRTRTLPSEFQCRAPLAVSRLRSVAVGRQLEDHHRVRHAEHCGGRRSDPALIAALGLCPRNSSVELPSPFRRSRSVAVDRQFGALHRCSACRTLRRWTERSRARSPTKTLPLKFRRRPATAASQATETENSFRSQRDSARPPRKFPYRPIKQKTFAVATVRDCLGVRHAEHREKAMGREMNSARSEFAGEPSNGHSRRRAQRGRAAKNSLLSQREHH